MMVYVEFTHKPLLFFSGWGVLLMVTVDIDPSLYDSVKSIVKKDRLSYPSVKHFVQKHLCEAVQAVNRRNNKDEKDNFTQSEQE